MKDYKVKLLSFVALLAMAVAILPANAAGKVVTASSPVNGEILSAVGGYASTTISWTSSALFQPGDAISFSIVWSDNTPASSTNPVLLSCATNTAFGGSFNYVGLDASGGTISFTGAATSLTGSICVRVPVTTDTVTLAVKNFSMAMITAGSMQDYGAAMFYVNGGDDVLVTAIIPPTLSFMIASSTSLTTEKHDCVLGNASGIATPGVVWTCDYRLKLSTNAASGWNITQQANHDLATAAYATMTKVGVSSPIVANVENYGFGLTGATLGGRDSITGLFTNAATEVGAYSADNNPVAVSPASILSYTGGFYGTSTASTSLVTHKLATTLATPAGYYSQLVTYRATGTF